jgi:hypothetical protein
MVRTLGLLAVVAITLSGCTRARVYMKQTDLEGGSDYVIVKIKARTDIVYDCKSAPEGEHDPVCLRVEFRDNSVTSDRRNEKRAEKMEDN